MHTAAPLTVPVLDLVRRRREPAVVRTLRSTAAAVVAYVAALQLSPDRPPLLAPLTAVLVVQVSLYSTLTNSIQRIASVVAGVLIAVGFADLVGLTWWSLGLLVLAALGVGHALRLGPWVPEVAVSAMLVLGVANPAANALNRLVDTLIGAGAGVLLNLVIPPPVYVQPAGEALHELAARMARLLWDMARELPGGATLQRTEAWVRESRLLDQEITRVDNALTQAEDSLRLNPRGRPLRQARLVLRHGLDSLERCSVTVRSLCRSFDELARAQGPDQPVYTGEVAEALSGLLTHLADALDGFGRLIAARAASRAAQAGVDLAAALDAAHRDRQRTAELLRSRTEHDPDRWELHGTLLANASRLLDELDVLRQPGWPVQESGPASRPSGRNTALLRRLRRLRRVRWSGSLRWFGSLRGSGRSAAPAQGAEQAQREEPDQRGTAPEVVGVPVVEGARVPSGVLRCRVALGTAGTATAQAPPHHGVALGGEAEAVPEETTAQHQQQHYARRAPPQWLRALRLTPMDHRLARAG